MVPHLAASGSASTNSVMSPVPEKFAWFCALRNRDVPDPDQPERREQRKADMVRLGPIASGGRRGEIVERVVGLDRARGIRRRSPRPPSVRRDHTTAARFPKSFRQLQSVASATEELKPPR